MTLNGEQMQTCACYRRFTTLVLILKEISSISQIVLRFASLQLNVMNLNKNLNISHQILKKN